MAAKRKKHTHRVTAGGRSPRIRPPDREEGCPWTHRLLAALAGLFLLAAVGQTVSGAAEARYAAWKAGPSLEYLAAKSSQLPEITIKREVQKAFREGGLYVPLEDVILSAQTSDPTRAAAQGVSGKALRVWVSIPFRVPWVGTFVYMWPRSYPLR